MEGNTHFTVGAGCASVVMALGGASIIGAPITPVAMGTAILFGGFGGLAPDIDIKNSKGSKIASKLQAVICTVFVALLVAYTFISKEQVTSYLTVFVKELIACLGLLAFIIAGKRSSHRGITHSFASSMFTTLCVWVFGRTAAIMWFVGYLSHLVIDYLNTKGEQLFWPMPNRSCLKLCKANSPVSRFLFYLGAIVVILSTASVFIL